MAIFSFVLLFRLVTCERKFDNTTEVAAAEAEELLRLAKECELKHSTFNRKQCFDELIGDYLKQPKEVTDFYELISDYLKQPNEFTEEALRHCGSDGYWLDRNNQSSFVGWTNFIKCFPSHMRDLLENISSSADGFNSKISIATWIRACEIFGYSLSSMGLIVALIVFYMYPKLLNHRTRIHRHLMSILLLQAITTLSIYIDQEIYQFLGHTNTLCVFVYTTYELLTSFSFSFMSIEGIMLYRVVSANALRPQLSYRILTISGYVYPCINVILWFLVTYNKYGWSENNRCWFGYNLDNIYWVLQAPRLLVLGLNVTFIMMVVKILLKKLAQNDATELQRIKTAARATVLLMPLLGITNLISMTNAPLKTTAFTFAVWAFCAYFFKSLQGFLVSYIYCFRNSEVLDVVCRRQAVNERNDVTVRFRATNTDYEIGRRDDELSRYEAPGIAPRIRAVGLNRPYNDADSHSEVYDDFELGDIIVHRYDVPTVHHETSL